MPRLVTRALPAIRAACSVAFLPVQAGAAEKGLPLYKYIAHLAGNTKLVSGESPTDHTWLSAAVVTTNSSSQTDRQTDSCSTWPA
jgi:hypothetical protein